MRRRADTESDRLAATAISKEFFDVLDQVMRTLSEREAGVLRLRFGLGDAGRPHSWDEIGQVYGVTAGRVRTLESTALRKLREHWRAWHLEPYLDQEFGNLWALRERLLAGSGEAADLIWCDRHGWQAPEVSLICAQCPCPLPLRGGRRRSYCSDACRQAAYRQRRSGRRS